VYAAWLKLGELLNPLWPTETEDFDIDRRIQERLKSEFREIGDTDREGELLTMLAETALEREIVFKKASIERFRKVVEQNYAEDKILADITRFVSTEINRQKTLVELEALENLTNKLADFVSQEYWQKDKFRKDLFWQESDIHKSYQPITMNNVRATVQSWLEEVEGYRKLEKDPRRNPKYAWDDKKEKIERELARKQIGDIQDLYDEVKPKIDEMRLLPAIKKHEEEILRCEEYWQKLVGIANKLKPDYCLCLDLDNERLVFAATTNLHLNFEPIDLDNKEPVALTAGWEQIRQAIEEKEQKWVDFFHTIDLNKTKNVGWPRYIVSKKDPSVILRFIPASSSNPEPFYAATHEITNAQCQIFLEKTGARSAIPLRGWSRFVDQSNNVLIQATIRDYPPCAIKWHESKNTFAVAEPNEDVPVTYVTYYGAQSYAKWLGAQLPKASQHEYACRAHTNNMYDSSQIASYAHVRAAAWQLAASEYISKKDSTVEYAPEPVGAVDDLLDDDTLETIKLKLVHQQAGYNSAWPIANASQPNPWGLYDMIGNVWEWCRDDEAGTQSIICGGSCLSPPEYARPDSKYEFQGKANDVGFRIVVPAR